MAENALAYKLLYQDDLVSIYGLVLIFQNNFSRFKIEPSKKLYCIFAVFIQSNNDISNMGLSIFADYKNIAFIDIRIHHRVIGSFQNIVPAIPEKGNRNADIFTDVFFLCLRGTT